MPTRPAWRTGAVVNLQSYVALAPNRKFSTLLRTPPPLWIPVWQILELELPWIARNASPATGKFWSRMDGGEREREREGEKVATWITVLSLIRAMKWNVITLLLLFFIPLSPFPDLSFLCVSSNEQFFLHFSKKLPIVYMTYIELMYHVGIRTKRAVNLRVSKIIGKRRILVWNIWN